MVFYGFWEEWRQLRGCIFSILRRFSDTPKLGLSSLCLLILVDFVLKLRESLEIGQVIDLDLRVLGSELLKPLVDKVLGDFGAYV